MRRGWILAGAVILAAVPSVPMAATGVSLVLERVNDSGGEVGKWTRTGDVQRFRIRLNGMGERASVAVAASPVEALAEVTCMPSARAALGLSATPSPPVIQAPPATGAGAMAVPSQDAQDVTLAAQGLAVRALKVAGASAALPDGAQVCRLGSVTGERSVDVTLTAPDGAGTVVLAAAANMRAAEGDGLTTMQRTVTTRVTDTVPTISGPATAKHGSQGAETPGDPSAGPETPVQGWEGPEPATVGSGGPEGGGGSTAAGGPLVEDSTGGRQAPDASATAGREQGKAEARPRRTGIAEVRAHPTGEAATLARGRDTADARRPGPADEDLPSVVYGGGQALPHASASAAGPDAAASAFPGMPGEAPGLLPQASPAPGAAPPPLAAAPPGAPLPWEMAAATKRAARPDGRVSPLKGPVGHTLAVGAIATLLGALWVIVTVQKRQRRRMVS
ncbi:hypothetical protein [Nonomuraea sp. SYSU D8015]|uniref:hypothetical protein n=1 Tax=Nonomuraea sp. SYSU D8015 TaxID=2593644 RepID=UPI001661403F|nr:hypothetical protein [Nonomuraea sp. SYSU D8015]